MRSILETYNVGSLIQMADALRIQHYDTARKATLVAMLASFLGTPEHLAAVEPRLTQRQWQTLAYPRLREQAVPLDSLQVRLRAQGATAAQVAAELHGLFSTGCLLFVEQPVMKEKLDPTPANLSDGRYSELRVAIFPRFREAAAERTAGIDLAGWPAAAPVRERAGSFLEVQRDAYLALRAAADGQIRVTVKDVPFKADVTKLASGLAGGTALGKGARKKKAEVPVPPRLWFALATLVEGGLLSPADGKLVTAPATAEYLRAPAAEQAKHLFRGWLDCVFSEFYRIPSFELVYPVDPACAWVDPNLESIGATDIPTWDRLKRARQAIVTAIAQGTAGRPGQWLSFAALSATLRADDPECLVPARSRSSGYSPYYYGERRRYYEGIRRRGRKYPEGQFKRDEAWDEVEGAYFAQVLREPLSWLGLVDLGEDVEGNLTSFRLTALGQHVLLDAPLPRQAQPVANGPALVVQPNFDLVVMDATANLGLLAQLDDFAERVTLDRAATYRLTRTSVVRGLEKGHTGDEIASSLESAAGSSLPQNVAYSIAEWARLYERVHLRRAATLLVADSPAQAAAWLRDKQISGLLGRQLSATAFLVPAGRRHAIEEILGRRGEAPHRVDYAQPQRRLLTVTEPAEVEVIARHDEPYVRYRLGRFADPVDQGEKSRQRLRYRITPESVRRAVERGLSPAGIVGYLQGAATGPVPDDTLLRIRGWAGAYVAFHQQAVVAVQAPPGLTWAELQAIPAVRKAVVGLPGSNVALLDPARFDAARAALVERGLAFETGLPAPASQLAVPSGGGAIRPSLPLPSVVKEGVGAIARQILGTRADPREQALVEELLALRLAGMTEGLEDEDDDEDEAVTVVALPPNELRRFLEGAIKRKRQVVLGVKEEDGSESIYEIRPKRLWEGEGGMQVDGLCEDCEDVHTFAFSEILGVGEVSP